MTDTADSSTSKELAEFKSKLTLIKNRSNAYSNMTKMANIGHTRLDDNNQKAIVEFKPRQVSPISRISVNSKLTGNMNSIVKSNDIHPRNENAVINLQKHENEERIFDITSDAVDKILDSNSNTTNPALKSIVNMNKCSVKWSCISCNNECIAVTQESRCICGHRLKNHDNSNHSCMTSKCKCKSFFFIVAEGAWILRCRCKHKHTDHDSSTREHGCLKCSNCQVFESPWICNCGHSWNLHTQLFTTADNHKVDKRNYAVRQDGDLARELR